MNTREKIVSDFYIQCEKDGCSPFDALESCVILMYSAYAHKVYTDEIERLQSLNSWIPVSERLPEKYEPVLTVYCSQGGISAQTICTRIEDDKWLTDGIDEANYTCNVLTHWRPLPSSPEVTQ